MSDLTLKINTPGDDDQIISCDSVTLWMAPDTRGKGEGSIGIRKGHTEAVIALGNGPLTALLGGRTVFSGQTKGGFATVLNDVINVITPHLTSGRE